MRLRLALLLSAIVLPLVSAEVALRALGKLAPPPSPLVCSRPELYQPYEPYGYRLWPSRTSTYNYPKHNPRTLTVHANADGFRSRREFDAEGETRRRILIVGDSFVFGEGVEEHERFSDLLETRQPNWRVDNMGMTGYGLDLMLRAFETLGHRAAPETVVLVVYTDDFRRVDPYYGGVGYPIPRYALRNQELVTVPYPDRKLIDGLHITRLFRRGMHKLTGSQWRLNFAILDRIHELSTDYGASLRIVFLPGRGDMPQDKERRRRLRQYAESKGTAFVDLTEPIHAAGVKKVFIEDNWHLNPIGHALVADKLAQFLESSQAPTPPR